ncbi:deleted in malignant brain tumors 1 protein-like, partial [Saccostrea cucullata]|uniref:deleted in malignant brain tumors 1 protein-like n=1 Tax=Saccostrea cuccullata TaxID=36930 RepID=UPI002ED2A56F
GLPTASTVFGEGNSHNWLDGINCTGHEVSLLQCSKSVIGANSHISGRNAGVICYPSTGVIIRIVNGSSAQEGRIEVLINGQWRSVCDGYWDRREADVTCKVLGYSGGLPAHSSAFGGGDKDVWLDGLNCNGKESSLLECSHSVVGSSSCGYSNRAGVVCYHARNDSVRIVNGSSQYEGRVEVLINDEWRTLCDRYWDKNDAAVTCKSLGYSRGLPAFSSLFGEGNKETWWLDRIYCNGYENSLVECQQSVISSKTCNYDRNAGVVCLSTGFDVIRIANGSSFHEGRVEVFINGKWRTICSRNWNKADANVACRSLGYKGGLPVTSPVLSEEKDNLWMLGDASCSGSESSLSECRISVIKPSQCINDGQAGVVCQQKNEDSVRIVNGSYEYEGRVDVLVNSEWHTVCNSGWDKNEAGVVCRNLKYSRGLPASLSKFGQVNGQMQMLRVYCNGRETSFLECQLSVVQSSSCIDDGYAGVVCYQALNDSVRIVNGSSPDEGQVEVYINDHWQSVCDIGWDKREAEVVCKSIGYSGGVPAPSSTFGEKNNQVWMLGDVYCYGSETSLFECRLSVVDPSNCVNGGHAAVLCYHSGNDTVRIVNGTSEKEGRVEVLMNGEWLSICDSGWDKREADVTCRRIGYSGGLPALSSLFGEQSGQTRILGDVYCNGGETSLLGCRLSVIESSSCTNGGRAGVICYDKGNDTARITNGSSVDEGRAELLFNGEWRSVCDSGWDKREAGVLCKSLGYSGGLPAVSSMFGEGSKRKWMFSNFNCYGGETSLFKCGLSIIEASSCVNDGHAGVVCYHSGNDSVRMVNGSSMHEGRVEIYLGGQWHSVCDSGWDRREADVTCRSIGYSG